MLRTRIIPCLLIQDNGLVKTTRFRDPKYVGDPINAVRIFNEKQVDELIVLDIHASAQGRQPNFALIEKLAAECRMPLCYGGGVSSVEQADRIIGLGVEKISFGNACITNPSLLHNVASRLGRQSVVAVLDVQKHRSEYVVTTHSATRTHKVSPLSKAAELEQLGVGELLINSVDLDGTGLGYDTELAEAIRACTSMPLTVLGGAGSLGHMRQLAEKVGIIGAAAGSLFVFKGRLRAVLISYPAPTERTASGL